MTAGEGLDLAAAFIAGSHFCDRHDEHPHKGCECPCPLCFAFWHHNVFRYEQAEQVVRSDGEA